MNALGICKCCGRTINKEFVFCPWCGESRLSPEDKISVDQFFSDLKENSYVFTENEAERNYKLDEMQLQLDQLDMELSCLALSVEMHK